MNPCTGLVSLTANGIPPIKVSEPRPPAGRAFAYGSQSARAQHRWKVKTPASLSARLPTERLPEPPGKLDPIIVRVTQSLEPHARRARPPPYARRFGWSCDEKRQWMLRQQQKLWTSERRLDRGKERPRLVQRENSSSSVGTTISTKRDMERLGDKRMHWCRKAAKWVQDTPSEEILRVGIAAAAVSEAAGDLSVPSMNDGLDDESGAWWDSQADQPSSGEMFPPVKPMLRNDLSALHIRKLVTPRERGRRREPLSLAGKHSQQFYGVEILEHLGTVRKHLTSPLQRKSAHM